MKISHLKYKTYSPDPKYFIFLVAFFLIWQYNAFSKNYYFASSIGNDSYTSIQAQNANTPWKTIDKLNNSMSLFAPGDSILFKRGDEFIGQIILTRSGTPGGNIVIGAYGEGNAPVVKGTLPITSWTMYSENIWVASCPQLDTIVTNFFINGVSQQIGRYPNANATNRGYLNIDSHIGHFQLTNSSLSSAPDWTGGEASVRTERWILDRVSIASHSGNTLNFGSNTMREMKNNYGFFIQNHINTLDQQGEWYFDAMNKKMYLYYITNPNSLKTEASAFSSTFMASNQSYFSIENIHFIGSVKTNIYIIDSHYVEMKNNIISESGSDAVIFQDCGNIDYKKNIIINTNSNALGFYNCKYITASYNEIKNTALRAGMGSGYMGVNMHYKVENCLFENNLIDSVGYDGIRFGGDNITIRNNVITNFCMILDDGGGIYTGGDELLQYHDRQIQNNIILNGIGAGEGTDLPTYLPAEGIYIDDCSINATIINNSVANCNRGIFIHNANTISIIGNTLYNNETQLLLAHNWTAPECPINQCVIKENIYFSKLKSQVVADFMTIENDIQNFGTIDYNYYCRPIDDDLTIYSLYIGNSGTTSSFMNLATWQSTFNYDLNSKKSLFTVPAYHITNLRGTSKLENGKFNSDIEGWNYWSNYDNGYATWDNNNDLDGGCLKLGFNITSGKADGLVLSYVSFSEAIAGENYILKFSMVASTTGKRVKIYMRDNDSPRNYITPVQYVYSDTKRTEHELHFVPDSTKTNARIDFEIKDDDGPIWIDNVELYNADVKTTNMDDHVKFLYNPGISALAFNVGGNCYDVKGNKYGSFILQPYTSVILMSTSPITNMNIKQTYNSFIVYPNPVNNLLFISTTDTLKETVIIIDISGRVVYEEDRNSGNLAIDVSSLSKGIFLIQLKDYKNIATAKFIKN